MILDKIATLAGTIATAYPGQSITVMLSVKEPCIQNGKFWAVAGKKVNGTKITIAMNENEVPPTACRLSNSLTEATQIIHDDQCTTVYYTILHSTLSYFCL